MVFSSPIFLFLFLPLTVALFYVLKKEWRNLLLLLSSLLFYSWGEGRLVLLLIISILFNYLFGILIETARKNRRDKFFFITAVAFNLGLLLFFKYTNFLVENINVLLGHFQQSQIDIDIHLPLGISFFTFQSLSYVIDVYRRETPPHKNPLHIALYISLFPQLVAGPIIRYGDIKPQFTGRKYHVDTVAAGIKRFTVGLGKKVLIANPLGEVADIIFNLSPHDLTSTTAWLGIIAYSLQIYFDFSGYSDMAIGLGRIFGFRIMENFNFPYISRSITEFWRRWHISLSTWLRDYLFLPIAYSVMRKMKSRRRFRIKIETWGYGTGMMITMLLGGLWHGANWNFVVWGAFHGLFSILEKTSWGKLLKRLWSPLKHIYALSIIMLGWVIFRTESMAAAVSYIKSLLGLTRTESGDYFAGMYINNHIILILILGVLLSTPLGEAVVKVYRRFNRKFSTLPWGGPLRFGLAALQFMFYNFILIFSIMALAADTYNPFLYFRF